MPWNNSTYAGNNCGVLQPMMHNTAQHMTQEQVVLDTFTECGTVFERWKNGWSMEQIVNAHFGGDIAKMEYNLNWGIAAVFELVQIHGQLR